MREKREQTNSLFSEQTFGAVRLFVERFDYLVFVLLTGTVRVLRTCTSSVASLTHAVSLATCAVHMQNEGTKTHG